MRESPSTRHTGGSLSHRIDYVLSDKRYVATYSSSVYSGIGFVPVPVELLCQNASTHGWRRSRRNCSATVFKEAGALGHTAWGCSVGGSGTTMPRRSRQAARTASIFASVSTPSFQSMYRSISYRK